MGLAIAARSRQSRSGGGTQALLDGASVIPRRPVVDACAGSLTGARGRRALAALGRPSAARLLRLRLGLWVASVGEETFLDAVEQAAGITRQEAGEAVRATLRTLAERITRGEAEDVAPFVPGEFREILASGAETAEPFGAAEFVRRVARREGIDGRTAVQHVRAVFTALGKAASPDALNNLAAQLSKDFDPLLEAAWRAGGSETPQVRTGFFRGEESDGEARDRLLVGCVSENTAQRAAPVGIEGTPCHGLGKRGLQGDVATTRPTTTASRQLFAAYQAVDQAFQRLFEVDARLLYGIVVPVLAISGLVVILAFDPSNWLLALVVVLLLLASLIVVAGIVRMLSDNDARG